MPARVSGMPDIMLDARKVTFMMLTVTQWQQLLLCITWLWPVMTLTHFSTAGPGDIAGAVFWGIVWTFCGVRLQAKKRWPF
jgi:hypothetical protein